jgi:hypothetical protein
MELESVENVVVNILSRHDCSFLAVADLLTLCTRVYVEHLLPQLGLGSQHMPPQLHSLASFTEFLGGWNPSHLMLIDEGSKCYAQLVTPLQESGVDELENAACVQGQTNTRQGPFAPYETPDPSEHSGNSSAQPFCDFESDLWSSGKTRSVQKRGLCATYELTDEQVYRVRQMLCRCLFDFVVSEANAVSYATAISLEDARQTCVQYLVCCLPRQTLTWCLSSHLISNSFTYSVCLLLDVMIMHCCGCGGLRSLRTFARNARTSPLLRIALLLLSRPC